MKKTWSLLQLLIACMLFGLLFGLLIPNLKTFPNTGFLNRLQSNARTLAEFFAENSSLNRSADSISQDYLDKLTYSDVWHSKGAKYPVKLKPILIGDKLNLFEPAKLDNESELMVIFLPYETTSCSHEQVSISFDQPMNIDDLLKKTKRYPEMKLMCIFKDLRSQFVPIDEVINMVEALKAIEPKSEQPFPEDKGG